MAETIEKTRLPHWDMTTIYPGLDSPEFMNAVEEVRAKIADLEAAVQKLEPGEEITDATVAIFALTNRINDVLQQVSTVRAFVAGYTSVDS
ncbi:MAG TPA: hypothetical protein VGR22_11675, partial [Thermomicrobiales bacterium]|nr:hypothetical protein [Thermomicrobiales bacterium]